MGLLDDAIREHLDLKRRRGADPAEIERAEREALGPVRREPQPDHELLLEPEPAAILDHEPVAPYTNGAGWDEPAATAAAPAELDDPWAPAGGQPELVPQAPGGSFEDDDPFEGDDPFESDDPFEDEDADEDDAKEGDDDGYEDDDYEVESSAGPAPQMAPTYYDPPTEPAPPARPAPPPVAATPPPVEPAPPREPPRLSEHLLGETIEYDVEESFDGPEGDGEDVLEETPEFLQDTPDHDRLWFEQRPPRDFDFEG